MSNEFIVFLLLQTARKKSSPPQILYLRAECLPLDDFALRTIRKTALNIVMHRSRDVFERWKCAIF